MGALRLLLAVGVAAGHFDADILLPTGLTVDYRWTMGLGGIRAVMLFYVISGFLISYVLAKKYPATKRGTWAFYLARTERIYPLWILLSVLVISTFGGWTVWAQERSVPQMLSGLFLLSSDWYNFAARFLKPPTGVYPAQLAVGWSLGVELTFYLLAPFLLRSWRLFAVGFLFSMGCRLFVNFAITTDPYDHITWMYFFLPTSLIFFLTGHLARLIYTWGRLPAAIGWASLAGSFAISTNQMSGLVDGPLALFSVVLFALALPAVFEATKNNRVLNFLGDQTYPLYLTHMVAIQIFFGAYGSWFAYGPQLLSWAKTMPTPRIGGTIVVAAFLGFAMVVTIAAYYIELLVKAIIAKLSHAALSQFRRIGSPPLVGPVVSASVGGTSVNRFAEAEGPIR